jgi:hypothetical protein
MCDFLSGTVMRASFSLASPSLVDTSVKLADGLFEKDEIKRLGLDICIQPIGNELDFNTNLTNKFEKTVTLGFLFGFYMYSIVGV